MPFNFENCSKKYTLKLQGTKSVLRSQYIAWIVVTFFPASRLISAQRVPLLHKNFHDIWQLAHDSCQFTSLRAVITLRKQQDARDLPPMEPELARVSCPEGRPAPL